jgi:haloacetate dehalogenase
MSGGLFPGFERRRIRTGGATINLVHAGDGPPLLLLHGYPETHAMWHKLAPRLARRYSVVCADLRGYGDSSKPRGLPDHSNYSKRAMAQDMAEAMSALGHRTFHVVGHDRGGRVAHRLARDHGSRVRTLTVLDISPTLRVFESTDMALARAFYHWFFLIQPSPMPERMIAAVRARYLLGRIGRGPGGLKNFPRAVQREYLRCFDRRGIHGSCEDYRAAAGIDLAHDRRDAGKKLRMPVLALWAKHSPVGTMFDCLADWRAVARDVRGRAIDCGHFLPEEAPRETLREIERFLARHEKAL